VCRVPAKRKVAQVDPDVGPIAIRAAVGTSRVGTPLCGKTNAVELCGVIDVLGRRKATCDIYLVVMATQQEVWPEIQILLRAVAGDRSEESYPQHPPGLTFFTPGRNFVNLKTRHRHQERRVQISPHGVATEVGAVQRLPRCLVLMARKGSAWVVAFGDERAVGRLDRDPLRHESHAPVGIAVRRYARPFAVNSGGDATRCCIALDPFVAHNSPPETIVVLTFSKVFQRSRPPCALITEANRSLIFLSLQIGFAKSAERCDALAKPRVSVHIASDFARL
jgi:hypothetical protein